MRSSVKLWVAGFLLFVGTALAFAHANVKIAIPPANATVKSAPGEVMITFTEALEPRFSTIEVLDAKGQRVDKGDSHVANGDARRLSVTLQPLSPGTFTVRWKVISVDTHLTEGSYKFTYAP